MYVNIEFLDSESIENVITALHFGIDKTIFIGYQEMINKYKKQTEDFLRNHCKVQQVEFVPVSEKSLHDVVEKISEKVEDEIDAGNKVFFDITGGEGLVLVAFGMLAREHKLPIHQFDVETDELMEFSPDKVSTISKIIGFREEKIEITIERYIEMYGGSVVTSDGTKNDTFNIYDERFVNIVKAVWQVACDYTKKWNSYIDILHGKLKTNTLHVETAVNRSAAEASKEYINFLKALEKAGAIHNYKYENDTNGVKHSFDYDSEEVKRCFHKAGTILELYVCMEMSKESDYCKQSVKIDWDDEPHKRDDVYNEIDVVCIKGNIPTFISCKGGNMQEGAVLKPMYELDTITNRFGGKYAKKMLVVREDVTDVYKERADKMKIKLQRY